MLPFALFWQTISQIWHFDFSSVKMLMQSSQGLWVGAMILFFVGVSFLVKDISILILNRQPKRKIFRLGILSGFLTILAFTAWILVTWAINTLVFSGHSHTFREYTILIAVSTVPGILMFLSIIPYLGIAIFWLLLFWIYILMLIANLLFFQISFWESFLTTSLGFILLNIIVSRINKLFSNSMTLPNLKLSNLLLEQNSLKIKKELTKEYASQRKLV
jgi:hypothetical protein